MSGKIKNNKIYAKLLNDDLAKSAINKLQNPIWPLCRLTLMLYLTSPYLEINQVLCELPDTIELDGIIYSEPKELLISYLNELSYIEVIKKHDSPKRDLLPKIISEEGKELDILETSIYFIQQNVLEKELESINSCLCKPMNCIICCTGPDDKASQEFFEIPLLENELELFDVEIKETPDSIATTPYDEPYLFVSGKPFYLNPITIYRWSYGYSLILPRGSRCPNLDTQGRCLIYEKRPQTCRKPQIFSKVIDKDIKDKDCFWQLRRAILAITDCPYVLALKDEITLYADKNDLDCIFMQNKI